MFWQQHCLTDITSETHCVLDKKNNNSKTIKIAGEEHIASMVLLSCDMYYFCIILRNRIRFNFLKLDSVKDWNESKFDRKTVITFQL